MIKLFINQTNIHDQYGVVLEDFSIGMPEAKLVKVPIPGRDGDLDMSEALTGFVNYKNREIVVHLGITGSEVQCEEKTNLLLSHIAGRVVRVEFTHLSGYFVGRCVVKENIRNHGHYRLVLLFDCRPYRLEVDETVINVQLADKEKTIECINSLMPAKPVIVTTDSAKVKYGSKTYSFDKGEHVLGVFFTEGVNELKLSGKGEVQIRYRRGCL